MAGPFGFTSYEVVNDERVTQALARAYKVSSDLRVPFAQIARDFQKSRKAIFSLSGPGQYQDLSIKPFKAWWEPKDSPLHRFFTGGYKEYKAAKYGSAYPILKATGRLEKSVTEKSHPENVTRIFPLYMDMGSKVPYLGYHQSDEPRKKLPLRKVLFIGPESKRWASSEISGFPGRALNTLNSFVIRKLGGSFEESTGIKPKVREK